jgi:hypothetical protein
VGKLPEATPSPPTIGEFCAAIGLFRERYFHHEIGQFSQVSIFLDVQKSIGKYLNFCLIFYEHFQEYLNFLIVDDFRMGYTVLYTVACVGDVHY